jgi:transcriptional regulator with XRE-family HTH domain
MRIVKLLCDSEIRLQVVQFGVNMRGARHEAGLSQVQLADQSGLDRAAISFFERAERAPNLGTLIRIAHATKASPAALLEGIGFAKSPPPELRLGAEPQPSAVLQFGSNLRMIRRAAEVSQESLAYSALLDRAAVSVYERGRRAANLRTILKLARALEVAPGALLSGIE